MTQFLSYTEPMKQLSIEQKFCEMVWPDILYVSKNIYEICTGKNFMS